VTWGLQSVIFIACTDIALLLPSDGGVQEVPVQVPAHGRCDANVQCVARGLRWLLPLSPLRPLLSFCKSISSLTQTFYNLFFTVIIPIPVLMISFVPFLHIGGRLLLCQDSNPVGAGGSAGL
jgi:hypothetical protein